MLSQTIIDTQALLSTDQLNVLRGLLEHDYPGASYIATVKPATGFYQVLELPDQPAPKLVKLENSIHVVCSLYPIPPAQGTQTLHFILTPKEQS